MEGKEIGEAAGKVLAVIAWIVLILCVAILGAWLVWSLWQKAFYS